MNTYELEVGDRIKDNDGDHGVVVEVHSDGFVVEYDNEDFGKIGYTYKAQSSFLRREEDKAKPEPESEPAGVKYDSGKPRPSLLPAGPLMQVAEVLTFGSQKYADDNWQQVPGAGGPRGRYADALLRHVLAWLGGERNDPESGLHHLAHAGCCVLFLLWFEEVIDA